MLASELVEALVPIINRRIDVPLIGEATEETLIRVPLQAIVPYLPEAIHPYLIEASDGLSDQERQRYEAEIMEEVVEAVTSQTPLLIRPFVGNTIEGIVKPVISAVMDIAQSVVGDEA